MSLQTGSFTGNDSWRLYIYAFTLEPPTNNIISYSNRVRWSVFEVNFKVSKYMIQ